MRVEFGNPAPAEGVLADVDGAQAVVYVSFRDGAFDWNMGASAEEFRAHAFTNPGEMHRSPEGGLGREVLHHVRTAIVLGNNPSWVAVYPEATDSEVAADVERFLAEVFGCPRGVPADLEETHYTQPLDGGPIFPPGVRP